MSTKTCQQKLKLRYLCKFLSTKTEKCKQKRLHKKPEKTSKKLW